MALGTVRQIQAVIGASALSLTLSVGGSAAYMYFHLNGNITTGGDLNSLHDRPPAGPTGAGPNGGPPINILLLGSQTRDGQLGQFGDSNSTGSFGGQTGTDISDTSMLLHISGDRKHALVVSIPRDTLVDRPACPSRNGKGSIAGEHRAMFDASMSLGGPLCAAATVEQFFHVRVDHFVRLDFNGFRKIVSYVGGVEICIPPGGINDPWSHLVLPAGKHNVTGDEALAFVRDRHGIGDGGDLGRIEMQKMFLTSMISKIESGGTLQDPTKLYQLANVTTSSITTDKALGSVTALLDLANQVQGLKPHDIHFVTMPTVIDKLDRNRVDPAPEADNLWQLINTDQGLDGASNAAPSSAAASSTASPSPSPTSAPFTGLPSTVTVAVVNGTQDGGLAGRTATALQAKGVKAQSAGNLNGSHPVTEIRFTAGHETQAQALVALFPKAQVTTGPTRGGAGIEIILGDDAAASDTGGQPAAPNGTGPAGGTSPVAPSAVPTNLKDRAADADICSNLPKPNPNAGGGD